MQTHSKKEKAASSDISFETEYPDKLAPVVVITSGKGGVGKTLSALATYIALKNTGRPVLGIDADPTNASFARQGDGVQLLNGRSNREMLQSLEQLLLNSVFQGGYSLVVDSGGGFDLSLRTWFATQEIAAIIRSRGVKLVILDVIDSSLDSASHVFESMDSMGEAHHIIVKNLGHIPNEDERAFTPLFANPEFRKYADHGLEVTLDRLPDIIEIGALNAQLHTINDSDSPAAGNPFLVSRTNSWLQKSTRSLIEAFQLY